MSEIPAPIIDSVLLDITGEMRVEFAPRILFGARRLLLELRLPITIGGRRVNDISPMAYRDMEWIGTVVRRQWSMLLPAVPFLLLGSFWMITSFGDWAAFAVSVFLFVFLGVFPLFLLLLAESTSAWRLGSKSCCFRWIVTGRKSLASSAS